MPAVARQILPTADQLAAASAAKLVIDAPDEGGTAPVVWYWSVKGQKRSWLGSWVPLTTWWWTYIRVGPDFRGQSECFEDVLAVFKAARKLWLEKRT